MVKFIWLTATFFMIYTIVPTLLVRMGGIGVMQRGKSLCGISLTFDDGPDCQYTSKVLDYLKKHNIRAAFFVLGEKATIYPELIIRMHQEGHLIGIHNYSHHINAILTPWNVRRQIKQTAAVIVRLTGENAVYYRPPWGVINLFDFLLLSQYRIVLWSRIVGDWRSNPGTNNMKIKLLSNLGAGEIIVLHDSGETLGADIDAPNYMLIVLEEFVEEAIDLGYQFIRVDEMGYSDAR
jgi:peptidoglycan/xylan/chitin deacetylase (PgdA/CDA1 family)